MKEEQYTLLVDESIFPFISSESRIKMKPIFAGFIKEYMKNYDKPIEMWLSKKLRQELPEYSNDEINEVSKDIIKNISVQREKQNALKSAMSKGRSKESWFASDIMKSMNYTKVKETSEYLSQLDEALKKSNESLNNSILTQAGLINKNPNLDGFIAEQYHAETFNLNAKAAESTYRAKVLEPAGEGYKKNSVDLVIVDKKGNIVRRYQAKYCKDAVETIKAFEKGDYRGQRKLVPAEQIDSINKKATIVIESPDGIRSTPLTKLKAKNLQKEAQEGNWKELNWNEYKLKDLSLGIGKKAGEAGLNGLIMAGTANLLKQTWDVCVNDEAFDGEELFEKTVLSGADTGIKAAMAGALKVSSEKGLLTLIPKGTPIGTITNIATVAVENVKVLYKIGTGEYSFKEGLDKMEEVTVSTVAGIVSMTKGSSIGAVVGSVFGPPGALVGGFVGGTLGYLGGAEIGRRVVKGVQKLRDRAVQVVKKSIDKVWNGFKAFAGGIKEALF